MNIEERTDRLYKILEKILENKLFSGDEFKSINLGSSINFTFRDDNVRITLNGTFIHFIINIHDHTQYYNSLKDYIFKNVKTEEDYLDLTIELQKTVIKLI